MGCAGHLLAVEINGARLGLSLHHDTQRLGEKPIFR